MLTGQTVRHDAQGLAAAATLAEQNVRFAVPPAQPGTAYRPLDPASLPLEQLCCFKYARVVAADNTVIFGGQRLQLLPDHQHQRRSSAPAAVEVHEHLDGYLSVLYGGVCPHTMPAPLPRATRAGTTYLARPTPTPLASAVLIWRSSLPDNASEQLTGHCH